MSKDCPLPVVCKNCGKDGETFPIQFMPWFAADNISPKAIPLPRVRAPARLIAANTPT